MRDVVRLGDPGIDEAWVRRRALGSAVVSTWIVSTALGVGAMTAGAVGPLDGLRWSRFACWEG
jgi:hypothetical protein